LEPWRTPTFALLSLYHHSWTFWRVLRGFALGSCQHISLVAGDELRYTILNGGGVWLAL